jgi:hypothetical protein
MDINPEDLAALTSKITPIGIEDLSCIESYDLSAVDGNMVHTIRFVDGGSATIYFRPDGTASMSTDAMNVKRFKEGGTLLCAMSDADVTGP